MSVIKGDVVEKRMVPRVSIDCSLDGMTKQSFKDSCNINTIVEKARKTGLVSHLNSKTPVYQDCSVVPDYQTALGIVLQAQDAFAQLSASVRERFANDPSRMIDFLSDVRNNDEAVKLGLIEKPVVKPEEPVAEV